MFGARWRGILEPGTWGDHVTLVGVLRDVCAPVGTYTGEQGFSSLDTTGAAEFMGGTLLVGMRGLADSACPGNPGRLSRNLSI